MKEQWGKNQAIFFCASETSEFCQIFKRPVANLPAFYYPLGELGSFLFDLVLFPEAAYTLLSPSSRGNNGDHATENGIVFL